MKIKCLGGVRSVTGSCFLLDNGKKYIIDCGLFQGGKELEAMNRQAWGFTPREISALFLTHAHVDHCGRIPKLVRDGFQGKIYATEPTAELARILLLDSGHIQEMEAEWQNRKKRRRGGRDVEPLYTVRDAEVCLPLFQCVQQDEVMTLEEDLRFCFRNAGHILGSSILEVWAGPKGSPHKVVFSGDLGQKGQLIVRDPYLVKEADTVFIESTYGNRNHKSFEESKQELLEAILFSYHHGQKVMIPAFAVARTQEILYILGEFFREKLIPSMPVFLDSPLAIAATEIFRRMRAYYDDEALEILRNGQDPLDFSQLVLSRNTEDSIAINQHEGPAIVIAGNGMCSAGRIKHHLKHNLWRQGASLVIVGFQAEGSLGRKIIEGQKSVRIFGENVVVRARVFTIGGFSAHADQSVLLEWLSHYENRDLQVHVIHGEENISETFASLIRERLGFAAAVPRLGEVIPLGPPRPEAVRVKADRTSVKRLLMDLMRRTQEIRKMMEESPEVLSQSDLERLQWELTGAESRLAMVLMAVSGADPSSTQAAVDDK
ncbi:MAG: MBL fold metallo-hydrolase [Deltaproteobacteria bacterium]|nr:MBL fold metallo-hydrolase [Deltaproteobacteria bacterium]